MTEEENKAIETLKVLVTTIYYGGMSFKEKDDLKVILRLIEKLQKENEELRAITNGYNSLKKDSEAFGGIPLIIADEKYFNEGIFTTNFIPKDKIRELLKEHNIELGEDTIAMSEQGAFAFMLSIKELLENGGE